MKKKTKKLIKKIKGVFAFGLAAVFAWFLIDGSINLFPNLQPGYKVLIGLVGLATMSWLGIKHGNIIGLK